MAHLPRVLIVADDLTGAMDSAGPFAQIGVETWVVAAPMQADPDAFRSAQVVSVNTDSRNLPGPDAAARLREVLRRLRPADFDLIVKKIDSTLRGNVVAAFNQRGLAPEIAPLVPVPPGSRRRAVLTARREQGRVTLGFHRHGSHNLVDIAECPVAVVERLRHYFLTYKAVPGSEEHPVEITHLYGREEAFEVIRRSRDDYIAAFMGAGTLR